MRRAHDKHLLRLSVAIGTPFSVQGASWHHHQVTALHKVGQFWVALLDDVQRGGACLLHVIKRRWWATVVALKCFAFQLRWAAVMSRGPSDAEGLRRSQVHEDGA